MIAPLLLLVALGAGDSTMIYRGVPADIAQIRIYEWREGRPPAELPAVIDRTGDVVSIRGRPGASVLAIFSRTDEAYVLDGPFRWPEGDQERMLGGQWRRSISAETPDAAIEETPIQWISASIAADAWPQCIRARAHVTCWGVPVAARGVAFYQSQSQIWWSVVTGGATSFRAADWGRLLVVRGADVDGDVDSTGPTAPSVRVRFQYPVPSSQRMRSIRVETADVQKTTSVAVEGSAVWVAGYDLPEGAWMQVQSSRAGPVYLPLRELAEGLTALPVHVRLPESRVVDGAVFGIGDVPASGAVITLFRTIEPAAGPVRDRDPPRRVFVGETTADAGGTFRFGELGEAGYEIVAWHPRFGRASVALDDRVARVEVHLQAAGVIRGRVVSGGRPLERVDVIGVPDQDTVRNAADLLDVKGGDAVTGRDGRFVVFLASAGGELRVGGGRYPVRRIPLPPGVAASSLDLGDIELGAAIAISVVLNDDPDCVVRAAGPVGRTGLQVVRGTRTAPAMHTVVIPEPGYWEFGLVCGERERTLSPGVVEIGPGLAGKEVRFVVR